LKHIDLFSGIGGFSLAASWVWPDHEVVCFCEMDPFCKKVLNKHWPGTPIVEDVNDVDQILAYAKLHGRTLSTGQRKTEEVEQRQGRKEEQAGSEQPERGSHGREISGDVSNTKRIRRGERRNTQAERDSEEAAMARQAFSTKYRPNTTTPTNVDLLTGGFPCQGFSVAGKQRGKADPRYLWPQMLEIIKAVRPRWVIGENVAGIIPLALDTVLSDLEAEGYTTRAFIIPACAKNAPHRRDRVWIVGRAEDGPDTKMWRCERRGQNKVGKGRQVANGDKGICQDVADTDKYIGASNGNASGVGREWESSKGYTRIEGQPQRRLGRAFDGLSQRLDDPWGPGWEDGTPRVTTGQKDRVNRLKALGNSIVPQVVYEIMMAIKEVDKCWSVISKKP